MHTVRRGSLQGISRRQNQVDDLSGGFMLLRALAHHFFRIIAFPGTFLLSNQAISGIPDVNQTPKVRLSTIERWGSHS